MNRDKLIQEYDDWFRTKPHKWTSRERNGFMLDVLDRYPEPEMILDVGCGNGHTLKAIQDVYPYFD